MPIKIIPVCRNCGDAVNESAELGVWVHDEPGNPDDPKECSTFIFRRQAAPIITVMPRTAVRTAESDTR